MRRYADGSQLADLQLGEYHRNLYGSHFWDIHRHDLIMALLQRAVELGVEIRVNSKVIDVDFDSATVTLESGGTVSGDLIIGCDGLNAITRKKIAPMDEQPEYTGDIAFRVLINIGEDTVDEDFMRLSRNPQVTYWLGPSGHAIVYILKGGRQINLVAIAPDDLPKGVIRAPLSKEETLKKFDGWDPILRKLLSGSDDEVVWRWKLHKRPELDQWIHPSGRFALLGDAVHPSLPYLSQGAAMALEDASVLGHILADIDTEKNALSEALANYVALRQPRTTKIVRAATGQQYWYHLHDGEEQMRRDSMMGADVSCEGDPFLWREPVFSPWLYGYDTRKEVEAIRNGNGTGLGSEYAVNGVRN